MSEQTGSPDWLDVAQDRLKDVGLDDAADCLAVFFRLVPMMETEVAATLRRSGGRHSEVTDQILAIIAKARGETTEKALARLSPPTNPYFALDGFTQPIQYEAFTAAPWSEHRPTPVADIMAISDQIRRCSFGPQPYNAASETEHESEPISPLKSGLADYLRPNVTGRKVRLKKGRKRK